jgi:hypothetical protein
VFALGGKKIVDAVIYFRSYLITPHPRKKAVVYSGLICVKRLVNGATKADKTLVAVLIDVPYKCLIQLVAFTGPDEPFSGEI